MNKKIIILLIILIVTSVAALFLVKAKSKSKYDYEIGKVEEYNYFIYKENSNYGVIDKQGNIVVDAKYENVIIPNPEKDVFICYNDEKTEALNANKNAIFIGYEEVEPIKLKNVANSNPYEKDTLKYKKDGKYGLIDFTGKEITKNIYDKIENLQPTEGKFIISKNEKYGVIDKNGNILVKVEYNNVLSDGYYTKEDGYKKSGFIVSNKSNDGIKYGYISFTGKEILQAKYNEITRIQREEEKNIYLIAAENGKEGFYKNSKKLIDNSYQEIDFDESTDCLIVQKNKKYGVASIDGKIIVDVQNDEITSRGIYLYAKKGNENKVYDSKGKVVNINYNKSIYKTENPDYSISTILNNDITYYGIIDKSGNQLVEENYRYIEYIFGNYFIVSNQKGQLGVINSNGREILDIKFGSIQKIKGKNIIQAIEENTDVSEFYSENLQKVASIKNANTKIGEDYIIVSNENEKVYLDNSGNIIRDSSSLKNSIIPDKIGDFKKEQITIENVYYVKE